MVQVLVAGLIALASKWLLDGGIRRRDRHVIREELELADMLGERPEAAQLRAAAEARLQRYLRPPLARRAAPALRSFAIFSMCLVGALVVLIANTDPNASTSSKVIASFTFGALAAVLAIVLQSLVDALLRLRATRAGIAADKEARLRSEALAAGR